MIPGYPGKYIHKRFGHNKVRPVIIGVIHGFAVTAALTLMIIPLNGWPYYILSSSGWELSWA